MEPSDVVGCIVGADSSFIGAHFNNKVVRRDNEGRVSDAVSRGVLDWRNCTAVNIFTLSVHVG